MATAIVIPGETLMNIQQKTFAATLGAHSSPPAGCHRRQVERLLRESEQSIAIRRPTCQWQFEEAQHFPGEIGDRARSGRQRQTHFRDGRPEMARTTSLLRPLGGDAGAGNQRRNETQQAQEGQGYWYEHWMLDSVAVTEAL